MIYLWSPRFISMTPKQQHYTLLTAMKFGGNFYKALAQAGLVADPVNRAQIFTAFPDLAIVYGPTAAFYSEDL